MCADDQDASKKICIPKFNKDASCPQTCSPTAEANGNATCIKVNLNAQGEPTSEETTCVKKGTCTAGKGQKVCPDNATISAAYACADLYGLVAAAKTEATSARRLVATQVVSGQRQTASLKFVLKDVVGTPKDAPKVKVKLDSILMLQPQLKSTLSMVISGSEQASMTYKITNLGASAVKPSAVADKLEFYLNSNHPPVKSALAVLGVVKLGDKGCCTQSEVKKAVVDYSLTGKKIPPTTTTTTTARTTTSIGPSKVMGSIELNVTLASGVTPASFVKDPDVKTGVEKGIAQKLGVGASWVSVTLTVVSSAGRRLTTSSVAQVKVDFIITVPLGAPASKSASSLTEVIKNGGSEKNLWESALGDAISKETSATYSVNVVGIGGAVVGEGVNLPSQDEDDTQSVSSAPSSETNMWALVMTFTLFGGISCRH
jgi:hypothetical protein